MRALRSVRARAEGCGARHDGGATTGVQRVLEGDGRYLFHPLFPPPPPPPPPPSPPLPPQPRTATRTQVAHKDSPRLQTISASVDCDCTVQARSVL